MMYTLGFIGTGNMGGALAKAACVSTKSILLCDHVADKAAALSRMLGCSAGDIHTVARECRYIFLGVKPQMMADMLAQIRDELASREDVVLVSMAAGLSIETVRTMAGGDYKVIRIMPNTPVGVGEGEILYTPCDNLGVNDMGDFLSLMKNAGQLTPLSEDLMDAGCAVSGCGPAFVFKFIRGLAKGGIAEGIDEDTALRLAAQTVLGAAKLLMTGDLSPDRLIDNVCSPGGSTIEGVRALDNAGFEESIRAAVDASCRRNKELGKA